MGDGGGGDLERDVQCGCIHVNVWCLSTDPTENRTGMKPCTFAM